MRRAEPLMKQTSEVAATLLIVEDHPAVLRDVRVLLSSAFPACRVLVAESGEQALDLCAGDAPCVVVMDIGLPGIDGIEATRRIKTRVPGAAVVMHSGSDTAIYRDAAAVAGASAFVPKQKTFSELVPAVTGLLAAVMRAAAGGR